MHVERARARALSLSLSLSLSLRAALVYQSFRVSRPLSVACVHTQAYCNDHGGRALQDFLMSDLPLRHTLAGFNKIELGADFVVKRYRCVKRSSIILDAS